VGYVRSLAISPSDQHVVLGLVDATIRVYNIETGELICVQKEAHRDAVNAVAVSPEGMFLASGSADKTIRVWRLCAAIEADSPDNAFGEGPLAMIEGHDGEVLDLAFAPGARYRNLQNVSGFVLLLRALYLAVYAFCGNFAVILARHLVHKPARIHKAKHTDTDTPVLVSGSDDCMVRLFDPFGPELKAVGEGHEVCS
jgi:WD40 domain-containing protein